MASRSQGERQKTDHSSDTSARARGGADTGGPQTEEWLAVASGAQELRKHGAPASSTRPEPELRDSTPLEQELSEIRARLAEVEATQAEHARLLREAAGRARRSGKRAHRAGREAGPRPGPKAETNKSGPAAGSSSINSVEWEELRALGVSVADSARLLATREVRGGFDSLEELDELRDFPPETVELLKVHFGPENSG
jgi:hypothetical protein